MRRILQKFFPRKRKGAQIGDRMHSEGDKHVRSENQIEFVYMDEDIWHISSMINGEVTHADTVNAEHSFRELKDDCVREMDEVKRVATALKRPLYEETERLQRH